MNGAAIRPKPFIEAAEAFTLNRVENNQEEDRDGHSEGDVHIGRRDYFKVRHSDRGPDHRQPVNRNQVHQVHEKHPDEYSQGQRRYKVALAVKGVFDARVNEVDDDLNERLHLPGLA
jgi:hypothetical protein